MNNFILLKQKIVYMFTKNIILLKVREHNLYLLYYI